ncbi:hypothetical protein LTR93_011790 [Exophiala xenobiotica]|nr:hypothetical protein LTR93_011790 [Exophiala xenobiotica]
MQANDAQLSDESLDSTSSSQYVKTATGTASGDEYGAIEGFNIDGSHEPKFGPASSIPPERRKKVIIVAAGVNGIQQASVLLRDGYVKHKDIQIFDALEYFGGVWQKNKYPGCACDVPSMIYTTSYFVNKRYTHFFAERSEIQEYYEDFAHNYWLEQCAQFSTFVRACFWDEEHVAWHVRVSNNRTGRDEYWLADIVSQCVGSLDRPVFGDTPDREKYQGISWHTAHWRHDYDLTAKNVAIIGCGPSVAQIIPKIVDRTKHL